MKFVIIGGCTASMTVASRLRRKDKNCEISVYEKQDYISFGACGLPYYISDEFKDVERMISRTPADFKKMNINIYTNSLVVNIDFEKQELTYKNFCGELNTDTYDQIFIGTGSTPKSLPKEWIQCENIFQLATKQDGVLIKKYLSQSQNIAVVGSGFIGLEVCDSLLQWHKNVTLIENDSRIVANAFEPEISEALFNYLESKKVKILLNTKVKKIEQTWDNRATEIIFNNNNPKLKIDAIIFAIGVKPSTDFLKKTKLNMTANGAIIVDEYGKTNIEGVWSCGDCSTVKNFLTQKDIYVPLATVARKFSKIVADNMLNQKKKFVGTLSTAIVKVLDFECARTGLSVKEAQNNDYDFEIITITDKDRTDYVSHQMPLFLKMIIDNKTRTIIGAQLYGYNQAVMRISSLVSLIWNKILIDEQLEQIDFPYSPPFSRPIDIVNIAISKFLKIIKKEITFND